MTADLLVFDVNGAIGALGQSLANGLRCARRSSAQSDDLAAVLFLQLKRLFERISVGLIDLETEIALLDPAPARVDFEAESRGRAPA